MIEQLAEQLKLVRIVFSAMAGTLNDDDLRATLIAQAEATDDDGHPLKYEDLPERDKKGLDEVVTAFKGVAGLFDEAIEARAKMTFKFFNALQKAGFDEKSALQITASQSVDMVSAKSS